LPVSNTNPDSRRFVVRLYTRPTKAVLCPALEGGIVMLIVKDLCSNLAVLIAAAAALALLAVELFASL
jgi:hypothetical protein